jgi:hypothetical protein
VEPASQQVRDPARVLLVDGDHQAARVRVRGPHGAQSGDRVIEHGREPLAVERQRRAEALVGEFARERIVERGGQHLAAARDPLHLATGPREVHRADDPSVAQGVVVAVLEVGDRLVRHVAHEWDRAGVAPERRPRERQAPGGCPERKAQRLAPRPVLPGVMDLVEHDVRAAGQRLELRGARRHALVRRDDAVHVGRKPAGSHVPGRIQVQPQAGRRLGPLDLEVRRRRHDHHPRRLLGQDRSQGREGERRLARPGRGHGQEIGAGRLGEAGEGRVLPRAKTDAAGHGAPGSGRVSGRAASLADSGATLVQSDQAGHGRAEAHPGRPRQEVPGL